MIHLKWENRFWRCNGFLLFLLLILIGIAAKEYWHHRLWLIPFHAAGGVVLFLWGYSYFNRDS